MFEKILYPVYSLTRMIYSSWLSSKTQHLAKIDTFEFVAP